MQPWIPPISDTSLKLIHTLETQLIPPISDLSLELIHTSENTGNAIINLNRMQKNTSNLLFKSK